MPFGPHPPKLLSCWNIQYYPLASVSSSKLYTHKTSLVSNFHCLRDLVRNRLQLFTFTSRRICIAATHSILNKQAVCMHLVHSPSVIAKSLCLNQPDSNFQYLMKVTDVMCTHTCMCVAVLSLSGVRGRAYAHTHSHYYK